MPPLYVVQQNAKLRIHNRRLQVERLNEDEQTEEVLVSLPLGLVDQVVLFGNIGLTTPAIDALLGQNTEVVFLNSRGEYRGRLMGDVTPHVPIRRAQYACLESAEFVLKTAQEIVRAKLAHQRALLQRHNRELNDGLITSAVSEVERAMTDISHQTALSSLRGLEGAATAAYFSGFRRLFSSDWGFNDRNRRPPADPVNAMLSFGYTLLAQAASGAVQAVGLDPFFGFLHEVAYNRPALGLDLMEEFRPVVDGIVLWVCRGGQITPQDFIPGPPDRPVTLGEAGMKRFIQAYEQRMDQLFTHPGRGVRFPLRQCLIEQARQVAARVQSGLPGFSGMGFR